MAQTVTLEEFKMAVRDFTLEVDTLNERELEIAFSAIASLYLKVEHSELNLLFAVSTLNFARCRYNERLFALT